MSWLSNCQAIISRQRIRFHYNRGNWGRAKVYATKDLEKGRNIEYCRDIILRSHWNLGDFHEVIDFLSQYPECDSQHFMQRARNKLACAEWEDEPIPPMVHSAVFDDANPSRNWYQIEQRVWFRHPKGATYWDMPVHYDIRQTHESLLELATQILLGPFLSSTKKVRSVARKPGNRLSLAYSGGVDSTAAMLMMPEETILSYHERVFPSNLKHGNARRCIDFLQNSAQRTVEVIPSNHELIRTHYGKKVGFSSSYAAGVHLILLADHFNLGSIAFGTVVENTWLDKGVQYRNFEQSWHWKYWPKRFLHAGLLLELPINHLTEACALAVCQQSPIGKVVNSCIRQDDGGCGVCWKCFHKNGPIGRRMNPRSKEITSKLNAVPLRSGMHALWALQNQNLEHMAPQYAEILKQDLTWWKSAYGPGLRIISPSLRSYVEEKTERLLEFMDEPYELERVNLNQLNLEGN